MATSSESSPARRPRFYYGWLIVWLSFGTLAFHVVTRFSFGIFQVPLIEEFGWSRGLLSGAFSLSMAVYALGSPLAGSLLEKKGPRALMPWGSVLLGATFIACFFIGSIWHVYLLIGLFGGFGLSLSGFSTHSAIIPRWFVRKRGRATGIALAGIGIGILVLAPLIERLIASVGWRFTYLIYGLIVLCAVAPTGFLLLRDAPEDVGQGPDGEAPRTPEELARSGIGDGGEGKGVREVFLAVKGDVRFWCLILMVFSIGLNNNTIMSQLQLYLVDIEYGTAFAAVIFGAVGFIRTLGSVGGGWVGDIIGRGRGVALSAMVVAAGLALLILIPRLGGGVLPGYAFALVYGVGIGGMSACYSALAGDCFGGRTYGVIIGFMEICYGLGGVVGPPFAGFMFDYAKSYFIPFTTIIVFMFISTGLALWLHEYMRKRGLEPR